MSQQQGNDLLESTIGNPAEEPEDYRCTAGRVGKSVLDGFDVTPDFVHVSADVLEVCFQFGDARFHINFSSGFCAVFGLCPVVGTFFCERHNLNDRCPDVLALQWHVPVFVLMSENRNPK